jgi:anti-sigma factor RsiW
MNDSRHLTDSELSGFLDSDLAPAERASVEAHLEACDQCRSELLTVARLISTEPAAVETAVPIPPRRPGWRSPARIGGLVAAAAAVIATLLLWPAGTTVFDQPMRERFGSEGLPRIETHSPPAGEVRREDLRFTWADHGTASYRITITAEDGALVWGDTRMDTVAVPPADLELEPGRTFFWYVDAVDVGVVGRTGVRAFTISP